MLPEWKRHVVQFYDLCFCYIVEIQQDIISRTQTPEADPHATSSHHHGRLMRLYLSNVSYMSFSPINEPLLFSPAPNNIPRFCGSYNKNGIDRLPDPFPTPI